MMLRCVPRRLLATKACSPGDVMKATRVFTREDLDAWARLTGDANAIHARPVPPFEAPIVPGLLLAATFPAVFARHHPGAVYRTVPPIRQGRARRRGGPVRDRRRRRARDARGAFATCATTLRLAATGALCVAVRRGSGCPSAATMVRCPGPMLGVVLSFPLGYSERPSLIIYLIYYCALPLCWSGCASSPSQWPTRSPVFSSTQADADASGSRQSARPRATCAQWYIVRTKTRISKLAIMNTTHATAFASGEFRRRRS